MPSSTPKQARTMAAAAHNPAFAKKVGIPQPVAQDFNEADTGTRRLSLSMKARQIARANALRRAPRPGPGAE